MSNRTEITADQSKQGESVDPILDLSKLSRRDLMRLEDAFYALSKYGEYQYNARMHYRNGAVHLAEAAIKKAERIEADLMMNPRINWGDVSKGNEE